MASRREKIANSNPFQRRMVPGLMDLTDSMLEGQEHAMVVHDDGTMQLGHFTLTSTGLMVERGATEEEWEKVGEVLHRLEGSLQWLIGDWLVFAEREWGKTYDAIAEATGYNKVALYDYKYVAENVPFSVRTENLSFGHHKLVAAKSAEEQREWLRYAEVEGLTVAQLRNQMQERKSLREIHPNGMGLAIDGGRKRFDRLWKLAGQVGQPEFRASEQTLQDIQEMRDWLDQLESAARNAWR
jgi:hypothetical protein